MNKLNPDRFTFDLYDTSYEILGLDYYLFPFFMEGGPPAYVHLEDAENQLIYALRDKAIGYCESSALTVRPRSEGYAILCENDDGEQAWFHISEELFQKVCGKK